MNFENEKAPAILLVDDNYDNLEFLQRIFRELKIRIVLAESGEEALERLPDEEFALILMDVRMPGMSGYETASKIQEAISDFAIPIIFITSGILEPSDIFRGYEVGAVDYLVRPVDKAVLVGKVRVFLELFKQRKRTENLVAELEREIIERKQVVSEREMFERQLRHAQKMDTIGTLAGGIAHDFNNILGVIIGQTDMILSLKPSQEKCLRNVQVVYDAAKRASGLVKQILAFSRPTKGDNDHLPTNLGFLIKETAGLIRSTISSNIEVELDLCKKNAVIVADPDQIHQVIMNLCTNAAFAIGEHDGRIGIQLQTVDVSEELAKKSPNLKEGAYVEVGVSDTGCGMKPEVIERIFEPFFTTKSKDKGTGLGLSVVYGIVREHGGEIIVESEVGTGTIFRVLFPRESSTYAVEESNDAIVTGESIRIMLVDDNDLLLETVSEMLVDLGHEVKGFHDAFEALEEFISSSHSYDLVITDHMMPKLTGIELIEKLRAIEPELPVILVSGFNRTVTRELLENVGVDVYLKKPFSLGDLSKAIMDVTNK